MEKQTVATRGDIEAVRSDIAGLSQQLAQFRSECGQQFGAVHTRNRKADHRQRSTQAQITLSNTLNGLAIDTAAQLIMLGVLFASQAWVNAVDSMPGWLRKTIPYGEVLLEQPEANPESKQVFAFSNPGQNLKQGDVVEGYPVTSEMGWRYIFGAKDWHEGVDLGTPVGVPLHAVLPVEVTCYSTGGGGLHGEFTVGTERHMFIHLQDCTPGFHDTGSVFATTGNSGSRTTGPHLDYRVHDDAAGEWVKPYTNVLRLALNPNADLPTWESKDWESSDASTLTDDEIICAIGNSEGTRDPGTCEPNHNWHGHTDPGNGVQNMGSFSLQSYHGATSPEHADQIWLGVLRTQEKIFQDRAIAKFGQPLSKEALIVALDAHTQSPKAAADYVRHLPSATPNMEQMIEARSQSFIGPSGLDAPGLGNSMARVQADQRRRVTEVMESLNK